MKKKEASISSVKYTPSLKRLIKKIKRFRKNIYIKKICGTSRFEVWHVHGAYIRKNICEDFVNFGQHYFFKFIPKNEFWVDIEAVPDEKDFYIDHLLVENRLMADGMCYEKAKDRAMRAEKRERTRSAKVRRLRKIRRNKKELIKKIHKKLLKSYSKKVKVWLVNGELVRDFFDVNFGGGSHDKVDFFMPENEIWIDDDISQKERKFVLLHELHERRLMTTKNLDYLSAHKLATKEEDFYRHNLKNLKKALNEEIEKQP